MTGLVGLKPSRAGAARDGFPAILHDFEVVGPLARCVDDIALVMSVLAGPRRGSTRARSNSVPTPLRILHAATFCRSHPWIPPSPSAVSDAAEALSSGLVTR